MSTPTTGPALSPLAADLLKHGEAREEQTRVSVLNDFADEASSVLKSGDLTVIRSVTGLLQQVNSGDTTAPQRIQAGTGQIDPLTAVESLVNSDALSPGIRLAIQELVTNRLKVTDDGTPQEVVQLRRQVNALPVATSGSGDVEDLKRQLKAAQDEVQAVQDKYGAYRNLVAYRADELKKVIVAAKPNSRRKLDEQARLWNSLADAGNEVQKLKDSHPDPSALGGTPS